MSNTGRSIPSVSAWAFSGVKVGESSDLYDSDDAYYLARLDSLFDGGIPSFNDAKDEIRRQLIGRKKAQSLLPRAQALAKTAATSGLESAAAAAGSPSPSRRPSHARSSSRGWGASMRRSAPRSPSPWGR